MMFRSANETSRRVADGGRQRAGSRGEGKQYNSSAEIIRMPSGSIVAIPPLEPINLSKARFNKALLFALFVNFICWGFILLAGRALAAVFL
jgi:type IV secretory pathway TraG/TraD family ATPase VirD4